MGGRSPRGGRSRLNRSGCGRGRIASIASLWRRSPTFRQWLTERNGGEALGAIADAQQPQMYCAGCGSKVGSEVLKRALVRLREESDIGPIPSIPPGKGGGEGTDEGHAGEVLVGLSSPDDAAVVRVPPGLLMVHTVDFFQRLGERPLCVWADGGKALFERCVCDGGGAADGAGDRHLAPRHRRQTDGNAVSPAGGGAEIFAGGGGGAGRRPHHGRRTTGAGIVLQRLGGGSGVAPQGGACRWAMR